MADDADEDERELLGQMEQMNSELRAEREELEAKLKAAQTEAEDLAADAIVWMAAKLLHDQSEKLDELWKLVHQESDRGLVLVTAAFLDDAMRALLAAAIVDDSSLAKGLLDGPMAPLGHFAERSRMACALGLISPAVLRDLDRVRHVRNRYAHSWKRSTLANVAEEDDATREHLRQFEHDVLDDHSSPRRRFLRVGLTLAAFLDLATKDATHATERAEPTLDREHIRGVVDRARAGVRARMKYEAEGGV